MIVYPAIDVRGGKVVRLQEGDPDRQTTFSDDPIATAQAWIAQGAEWLHMVNLDGAFDTENDNFEIVREVAKLDVRVQFGGGVRSLDAIQTALDVGLARVVVGTMAAQQPDTMRTAIERFGTEALCVAMDARNDRVTTHGWTEQTDMTPIHFGRVMRENGVRHALYTDVSRDGSLKGVNIKETVAIAQNTGLKVIASGGISRMIEIQELAYSHAVAGVVIGMALYKDEISLQEALAAAKESKA
jgi:phosphoribosylformimino-5-aminoimidazole carboxamide ribotide isomerase